MPKKTKKNKNKSAPAASDNRRFASATYREQDAARWLMWAGVTVIAVIIFGLWGWGFRTQLSAFNWKNTAEKNLMDNTKDSWDQIFADTQAQEASKIIKEKIQQALATAEQTNTTSTVATSTLVISSTSTNH